MTLVLPSPSYPAPALTVPGLTRSQSSVPIAIPCPSLCSPLPCRHVILPREVAKGLPQPLRLLSESEWRSLGVLQSRGWVHYEVHRPEPHILLFRRPLGTDPVTGKVTAAVTKPADVAQGIKVRAK